MLSVRNGARAVGFYKAAFGAREVYRVEDPGGAVVSRLSVDGAEVCEERLVRPRQDLPGVVAQAIRPREEPGPEIDCRPVS